MRHTILSEGFNEISDVETVTAKESVIQFLADNHLRLGNTKTPVTTSEFEEN